jgi:hypothetical protein
VAWQGRRAAGGNVARLQQWPAVDALLERLRAWHPEGAEFLGHEALRSNPGPAENLCSCEGTRKRDC